MPSVRLSHLEIVVEKMEPMEPMERFYAELLGFEVTDRSAQSGDAELMDWTQNHLREQALV